MGMKSVLRLTAAMAFLTFSAGCGITDPKPLIDEFTWEAVDDGGSIAEGVDMAGFFRDISFLGQVRTPTLCYSVASSLETSGNTLTVRIALNPTGSSTCAQTTGGFRYQGVIRNLERGTYTVRIIQTVKDQPPQEFTEDITV